MTRAYPKIKARRLPDGPWLLVSGREAETVILAADRKARGVRALDFPGGPAYRLAAYIFDLKAMGFPFRAEREDHAGGTHAVYFLECAVEIEVVALRPPGGPSRRADAA